MLSLTPPQRRTLTARAHTLNPIVIIGKTGLSNNVMNELKKGLICHELIKVKILIENRTAREILFKDICQQLNAAPVKHIGKILVIYRPQPEETKTTPPPSLRFKKLNKKLTARRTKRSHQN